MHLVLHGIAFGVIRVNMLRGGGGVMGAYYGKSDKEWIWSKSCWLLLNGGGAGAADMDVCLETSMAPAKTEQVLERRSS